jgi:DNA polymerase
VDEVTKDQRQVGKVQELACGFAGGVGAFSAMGRIYGIVMPESESRKMVDAWRRANPWSVPYWSELEVAYTRAIRNPKTQMVAGRVTYYFDGVHLWYSLPSGRVLCYPYALIEEDGVTYAKASWKPAADAKRWPRARLWKGLACENITQAVAADILRHALRQLPDVVLHVHDEIICETDQPEAVLDFMQQVMSTPPAWAEGLPLAAEAQIMSRYGKG